jgi:hypothetical protein
MNLITNSEEEILHNPLNNIDPDFEVHKENYREWLLQYYGANGENKAKSFVLYQEKYDNIQIKFKKKRKKN